LAAVVTSDKALKALVLYEDGCPEMERVARSIAERIEGSGRETMLRSASSATIPELLAAGLYLFGAETAEIPSYAEVARVLKGVNLAGRKAVFFGASGAAVARLRVMCADTEVSAAHADLVGRRIESAAIAAWLRGIA
jgi:hypothetical protein